MYQYLYFSTEVSVGKLEGIEGKNFYNNVGAGLDVGLTRVIDAVQARITKIRKLTLSDYLKKATLTHWRVL